MSSPPETVKPRTLKLWPRSRRRDATEAHRRIVDQHVADGLRLLVLRLLRRVAGLVERRVHDVAVAEQAELAAASPPARRHRLAGRLSMIACGGTGKTPCTCTGSSCSAPLASGPPEIVTVLAEVKRKADAGAGEQLLQRLLDRHRPVHSRAGLAGDGGIVHHDLETRLLGQGRQRLRERLRGNIVGRGAACLCLLSLVGREALREHLARHQ